MSDVTIVSFFKKKVLLFWRWPAPWLVAALTTGVVTLLARWALIAAAGSAIPYWDQWDGEGTDLYMRWMDGVLKVSQLGAAHMEHRIVLTNLWNLGWFHVLGGWDPLAQMVVNAFVPAIMAAFLVGWLLPLREGRWWQPAVMMGVVVIMAGPWGHQNTLWGFQSPFYFLIFLSVGVVVGLQPGPSKAVGWWLGLAAGVLVPLTMGAGAIAGAALAVVGAWSICAQPKPPQRALWAVVALGLVLMIWGLCWRASPMGVNELHAHSVERWIKVAAAALAWPWPGRGWWAVVVFAPAVWLAVTVVRQRRRLETAEAALLGIAVWTTGSMMAMAYARGGYDGLPLSPASRYLDVVVPGVLACGLLWWWLPGRAARIGGLIWLIVVLAGVVNEGRVFMHNTLPSLQAKGALMLSAAQQDIQDGGNGRALQQAGAHPSAKVIQSVLGAGESGGWLPPEVSKPPGELWALNQAVGTRFSNGAAAAWISPVFTLKAEGLLVLTQGAARLSIQSQDGRVAMPLTRLVDASGDWMRWGVRAEPGRYRLQVNGGTAKAPVTLLWPKPMSASAYGVRKLLTHATGLLIAAVVVWFVALAWLCLQPLKPDSSSGRR